MKITDITTAQSLLDWVKSKGYVTFEKTNWDLNIIGVRKKNGTPNKFDDRIFVVYRDDTATMRFRSWAVTTDPGLYWMQNIMNKLGVACLVPGQYRAAYEYGKHKGEKEALVQVKKVKTYRDSNKDGTLNPDPSTISEGLYGINIHRAGADSTNVDKWSAGCQVFAKDKDFTDFLSLCRKQILMTGFTTFTYTLLEEE